MKHLFLFLGFLLSSLYASEPKTILGTESYGTETIASVKIDGFLKLNGTTVTDFVSVAGSLISRDAFLQHLHVQGEANLTGTEIRENAVIEGSVQAVHSKFYKNLSLSTQKAVFTHSNLQNISFLQDKGFKGKQILELRQHTIVEGSVHFESNKGEVHLYSGSQVLGSVNGGKIVRK